MAAPGPAARSRLRSRPVGLWRDSWHGRGWRLRRARVWGACAFGGVATVARGGVSDGRRGQDGGAVYLCHSRVCISIAAQAVGRMREIIGHVLCIQRMVSPGRVADSVAGMVADSLPELPAVDDHVPFTPNRVRHKSAGAWWMARAPDRARSARRLGVPPTGPPSGGGARPRRRACARPSRSDCATARRSALKLTRISGSSHEMCNELKRASAYLAEVTA